MKTGFFNTIAARRSSIVAALMTALLACGQGAGSDAEKHDIPTVLTPRDVVAMDLFYDQGAGTDQAIGPDTSVTEISSPADDGSPSVPDVLDIAPDQYHDATCIPDCTQKECGSNGCGGSCGTCPESHECIASSCICIPNCSNHDCGDDGCGGTCGPGCEPGVTCLDFGKCAKSGPCVSALTLTCSESSVSDNNGWSGNSDVMDDYSCSGTMAHGPEKAYIFKPAQDGDISIHLEGSLTGVPLCFSTST